MPVDLDEFDVLRVLAGPLPLRADRVEHRAGHLDEVRARQQARDDRQDEGADDEGPADRP
ncbi:hypothetical protein [Curtobacterium sp. MCJR17_043]|uniref:hypothetical protein n=1 Tax=Curtobacterium sp. MCJR17_043 TaxID=2175660 RepID=UPI0024E010C8|nr:hypothetical protein [Curtobacterium sp. MCJR17_043]WIB36732.1 hypothetical protein DEJ15_06725 [Curtobacterium sp. MCJR17_043]